MPNLTTNDSGEIDLSFLSGEDLWYLAIAEDSGRDFSDPLPIITTGSKRALQSLVVSD